MARPVFLLVALGLAVVARAAPPAADDTPPLPPMPQRPAIVVDSIKGAGMLTPSAQDTAREVVVALGRRYGHHLVVLEDELINTKKLRRMAGKMSLLPPDADRSQRGHIALLEWANKESPWRVKVMFTRDGKKNEYVASAECRPRDGAPAHKVEGRGKRYEAAVEDLKPKLTTFCAVLDAAMAQWVRGGAGGARP